MVKFLCVCFIYLVFRGFISHRSLNMGETLLEVENHHCKLTRGIQTPTLIDLWTIGSSIASVILVFIMPSHFRLQNMQLWDLSLH
uniref:Uncharacterized protein n=1 Tax=Arundo donax TaxID=35708 RepID=A0A0A9F2T5_ARUDO